MMEFQKSGKQSDQYILSWLLEEIDDLRYRTPPTAMPKKVSEYYGQPKEVRKKMNKQPDDFIAFWHDPQVKKFFEDVDIITNLNRRNKTVLLWMKELSKSNLINLTKIDQYIDVFNKHGIIAWNKTEWPLFGLEKQDKIDIQTVAEDHIDWSE